MKKNNNKEKINPNVKKSIKLNNYKIKDGNEDDNVIKKLIIITVVIAFIVGIIYVVTELVKEEPNNTKEITPGSINYDKVSVGMLLNRPYDEYYVLIYNTEDSNSALYSTLLTKYMQKEDGIKIYFCDLNNKLNNKYYNVKNDNISNPKANKIEELDFGDITLIKVENKKIVKYIENISTIKELLK